MRRDPVDLPEVHRCATAPSTGSHAYCSYTKQKSILNATVASGSSHWNEPQQDVCLAVTRFLRFHNWASQ